MEKNFNQEKPKASGVDRSSSGDEILKLSIKETLKNISLFLKQILNIKEGTDIQGTINGIKRDIYFRGPNVWILVFSIFIASIGLNVNSTAVIIGAMLISPLMGPILGIGLAIGTNDLPTLIAALKNLAVAVFIAMLTSTVFFILTPLGEVQSELIARTKPTLLDVLIAIFGGLSGIIAGSRREKSNVVPGVAIATALMPPLCTAGFGLATLNMSYFLGAFYLFFINCVFICLSTLFVVRLLDFPVVEFINPLREKKVKKYIVFSVFITIIPSTVIFINVISESAFKRNAEKFIKEELQFSDTKILSKSVSFLDTAKVIDVFLIGRPVSQEQINAARGKLVHYKIPNATLYIHQSGDINQERASRFNKEGKNSFIDEIFQKTEDILSFKEDHIKEMELEIARLKKDSIPFTNLQSEIAIQYSEIEKFAYAHAIEASLEGKPDTIPTFIVKWKITDYQLQQKKLEKWLKVRLEADTLRVINYN